MVQAIGTSSDSFSHNLIAELSAPFVMPLESSARAATAATAASVTDSGTSTRSVSLQSQSAGQDAVAAAIQGAASATSVASAAVTKLLTITSDITTLTTQAADLQQSGGDLTTIQSEIDALVLNFNTIVANTTYNGVAIFSGSTTNSVPVITQSAAATFDSESYVGPYTTSVTVNLASAPTPGDLLVAEFAHGDGYGGGGGDATLSAPSGWTLVDSLDNGLTEGTAIYTKVATSADTGSYTWSATNSIESNTLTAIVTEISGADTSSPIAAESGDYNSLVTAANPLTTPTLTATASNELPLAYFSFNADLGTGGATVSGWNVAQNPYLYYNASVLETHALTTGTASLQAGYNPELTTDGDAFMLLIAGNTGSASNSLSAANVTNGNVAGIGFVPSIDAHSLDLSGVDVTKSTTAAAAIATATTAYLTSQQGSLQTISSVLNIAAEQSDVSKAADASASSGLSLDTNATSDGTVSLAQNGELALLAHSAVSRSSTLKLFQGFAM